MTTWRWRWWCMLWLIAGVPAAAFAHAVPVTVSPLPNSTLMQAPREVTMRFSERVEGRVSSLRVFDAHGHRVDAGPATVDAGDPWLYRVTLSAVSSGTYTVSWRVMSADDGHVTEGAHVFLVGETAAATVVPTPSVTSEAGWLAPAARGVGSLGGVVLLGILIMPQVFWRRRPSSAPPLSLVLVCFGAVVLGTLVALLAKADHIAPDTGLWQALGVLLHTTTGQVWAARIGLSLLLAGLFTAARRGLGRGTWLWWLATILALVILLLDTLVSHSAATRELRALALGAHMLHVIGMALWVGGLVYFASLFWRGMWREPTVTRELAWAMPTFSLLAAGAVGLLTLSGIYLARLHLGSFDSLASTPYGRILLAKLAIVAIMGALGGYHHAIVHRRILRHLDRPNGGELLVSRRFHRTLRLEAVLGGLTLFVAAFLGTTLPPPVAPIDTDAVFRHTREVGEVKLALEIRPMRPGLNTIRLHVADRADQPVGDVTTGLLQLAPVEVSTGPLAVTLEQEAPGTFVNTSALLGVAGHWSGRLTIQRQGAFDLHDRFGFMLTGGSGEHAHGTASTPLDGVMGLVALSIVGVTAVLLMTSRRQLHLALRHLALARQAPANHPERR